jgi:phosphatidate cytidylyltransferase
MSPFLSNLARRLATAAIALPLLALLTFRAPLWLFELVVGCATLLGLLELFALMAARKMAPSRVTALLVAASAFLDAAHPGVAHPPLLALLVVVLLSVLLLRREEFAASLPAAALTFLGALYLGALGGTLAALRSLPPAADGPWRLTFLFAVVMIADTCAYFVGSAIGRHKLAPRISPGKTWEGGIGALAGGVLTALAVRAFGLPNLSIFEAVLLGLGVTVFGTVGDLAESLLKRWAGVKDSGALFPGHGGMLDRVDSLLFGAPVLYYYFLWR